MEKSEYGLLHEGSMLFIDNQISKAAVESAQHFPIGDISFVSGKVNLANISILLRSAAPYVPGGSEEPDSPGHERIRGKAETVINYFRLNLVNAYKKPKISF